MVEADKEEVEMATNSFIKKTPTVRDFIFVLVNSFFLTNSILQCDDYQGFWVAGQCMPSFAYRLSNGSCGNAGAPTPCSCPESRSCLAYIESDG